MAGIQLSGLASGFDWKTVVDQLMELQRAPINRLNKQKTLNGSKVAALSDLGTKLTALTTSLNDLRATNTVFTNRTATFTGGSTTWSASAAAGTATGNYSIAVSQLATTARLNGASNIAAGLSATNDVSGVTLATMPTAVAVTAGTITVNGQQVAIDTADSLQDVFDAISTATGGTVTSSYDATTDKVTLTSSTGSVMLGAANDTSNFFTALKLSNNGTATTTSSTSLGIVKTSSPLASAGLTSAITAVDGNGDGSFTVNGVSISYNVNTDSLSTVLGRINGSSAGVTATYDSALDRVIVTNNKTGDMGISLSETAGGFLDAVGLSTGASFVAGKDAQFSVNGGGVLTSKSNTFDATAHGITGLSVTANSETTQTVAITGDTAGMKSKIQAFVDAFNAVQSFVAEKTKIVAANGKVTTSILTDNREVQSWATSLRSLAFGEVSGLSGTVKRLEHLGIDFSSSTGLLTVKDAAKLDSALGSASGDVAAFFQTTSTGLVDSMKTFITNISTNNTAQQTTLTGANTGIDKQIADMERRLEQQRTLLERSFIQMELAQQKLQSQSTALNNAFNKPTSK